MQSIWKISKHETFLTKDVQCLIKKIYIYILYKNPTSTCQCCSK